MSIIFNNIDNMSFDDLGEESEFIPLMTSEDEEALEKEVLPDVLSILPLTNTVLFPGVVIPINAGSDKSIKLIKDANKSNKLIGVVAQKSGKDENPSIDNIHGVGTVAKILRVLKMPDGKEVEIPLPPKVFKTGREGFYAQISAFVYEDEVYGGQIQVWKKTPKIED